ncbi:MAG: DUF951 domain-containing protein [Halanaerobiales bacterium]
MKEKKYEIGDIVKFKKPHPCGENRWKVIRIGMDFKVKCTECNRIVMMPRKKFEKNVKEKLEES